MCTARSFSCWLLLSTLSTLAAAPTPKWTRFERQFQSSVAYSNPLQDVDFRIEFTSPSGTARTVYGFWDGGKVWRVRFAPHESGKWIYRSLASDPSNRGLDKISGSFECGPSRHGTRFEEHGPIEVSKDGRHLVHSDGTPFFWLADSAWNGPLLAGDTEWQEYLKKRSSQKFSAVQWVATQWRGDPAGDSNGELPYTGLDKIVLNIPFFRRLDAKQDSLIRSGLLSVPVMLWAFNKGPSDQISPGVSLPESQAILLARYMLARWGADPVVWLLNADGDYRGEFAERWRKIGAAVFQPVYHAPVSLHPGGVMWVMDDFYQESWISIAGYQSSHSDTERNSRWITSAEPATYWKKDRARITLSLEGPYESPATNARATQPELTRRNHYWSLLGAPVVGITYGATGVWSWSNGNSPVPGHGKNNPPSWRTMLDLPGAAQMTHLVTFFNSINFWRLRPEPGMLTFQPGDQSVSQHVSAAGSVEKDLFVLYTPVGATLSLKPDCLPEHFASEWFNPRNGERSPATPIRQANSISFKTADSGDWLLLLKGAR